MPLTHFRLIHGTYQVDGFKPDGDSLHFVPADPTPTRFRDLYNAWRADLNKGSFQLRLEGIDAPETHYGSDGQPFGDEARDQLLKLVGVKGIERDGQRILRTTSGAIKGAILCKGFDPHGRPISYALAGSAVPEVADGEVIEMGTDLLAKTLNAQMIQTGFAYPLLYTSTPLQHRTWLREQAVVARKQGLGIWRHDSSREFRIVDKGCLCASGTDAALVFPKFFRRAMDYLRTRANGEYQGDFPQWLASSGRENDRALVHDLEVPLSTLFEQRNSRVRCQADVLDLVFLEK